MRAFPIVFLGENGTLGMADAFFDYLFLMTDPNGIFWRGYCLDSRGYLQETSVSLPEKLLAHLVLETGCMGS
jgi:hypothetical protein